jgi:hypothetical protein
VNGEQIATWGLKNDVPQKVELKIPTAAFTGGDCEIVFKIANPQSPASLDLSSDARLLGLGFETLTVG